MDFSFKYRHYSVPVNNTREWVQLHRLTYGLGFVMRDSKECSRQCKGHKDDYFLSTEIVQWNLLLLMPTASAESQLPVSINYNPTYTPKHYYRCETRTLKYTKHSLHTQSSYLSTNKSRNRSRSQTQTTISAPDSKFCNRLSL